MEVKKGLEETAAMSSAEKTSNLELGQTAADSTTLAGELRQSFGNTGEGRTGQLLGTDFTVAEDLHRRTPKEIMQDCQTTENRKLNQSQVFGSPMRNAKNQILIVSELSEVGDDPLRTTNR